MNVKDAVKRVPGAHTAYKMARQWREIPTREWFDVPRTRDISRVLPRTMLSMPRILNAYEVVRTVNRDAVPGDLVECGVWSGGCIALMALADGDSPYSPRSVHLFDSFQGLPQPSLHDVDVADAFRADHPDLGFDAGGAPDELEVIEACRGDNVEEVRRFLTEDLGLDDQRLRFHVGWFQETVPVASEQIERIAVLRLDGDWYESTRVCLEHLYDLVQPGGYVVLDDFGEFAGCRKAVLDFFEERGYDSSLITKIRGDDAGVFWRKPMTFPL